MHDGRQSLDFTAINAAVLAVAGPVLFRLAPGGTVQAGEYVALNPRRADHRLGSFRVNMRTGRWADFATGDRGGDIISYAAYAWNCSQVEAARALARMIGIEIGARAHG
ncbi:MAG: hypothetical protein P4L82_02040 [Ancalomicrobiaceae bacterium]|nr:hypothetical protein [Ancalomicrobiaceae bacterium]